MSCKKQWFVVCQFCQIIFYCESRHFLATLSIKTQLILASVTELAFKDSKILLSIHYMYRTYRSTELLFLSLFISKIEQNRRINLN